MKRVEWLENAVFYNIYPQSFYDTNGDGIGDLLGVMAKLSYIKDMGFTAIWLNPFYESPFRDAGYDVTDFYKVAPRYGTMADFEMLCEKAHALGIQQIFIIQPAIYRSPRRHLSNGDGLHAVCSGDHVAINFSSMHFNNSSV